MRVYAFPGIRYAATADRDPGRLAAPPYDQIDDALRDRLQAVSPHHFTHLTRPLPGPSGDPYGEADARHRRWLAAGVLTVDPEPSLYPYAIELAGGGCRLGLAALVGLEDPASGRIRPHERTLDKPIADRLALLRAMRVDLEPVLLLSEDGGALDAMLADDVAGAAPLVAHLDGDGHRHVLWRLSDPARIAAYRDLLAEPAAAIADGHHRYKVGLLYARETGASPDEAAGAKLAVVTSLQARHLTIDPIHRALRALPAGAEAAWRELPLGRDAWTGTGGAALAAAVAAAPQPALGVWRTGGPPEVWRLDPGRAPAHVDAGAAELTVVLFQEQLLPALGLPPAAATDGTVLYRTDPDELARLVQAGEVAAAFFLPPMTPTAFAAAIAHGDLLPPKSTRFLPKVYSGLVWAGHDGRLA